MTVFAENGFPGLLVGGGETSGFPRNFASQATSKGSKVSSVLVAVEMLGGMGECELFATVVTEGVVCGEAQFGVDVAQLWVLSDDEAPLYWKLWWWAISSSVFFLFCACWFCQSNKFVVSMEWLLPCAWRNGLLGAAVAAFSAGEGDAIGEEEVACTGIAGDDTKGLVDGDPRPGVIWTAPTPEAALWVGLELMCAHGLLTVAGIEGCWWTTGTQTIVHSN